MSNEALIKKETNNSKNTKCKYFIFDKINSKNFTCSCSWKAIRSFVKIIVNKNEDVELHETKTGNSVVVSILDSGIIDLDIFLAVNLDNYYEVISELQSDIISNFKNILNVTPNKINIIICKKR